MKKNHMIACLCFAAAMMLSARTLPNDPLAKKKITDTESSKTRTPSVKGKLNTVCVIINHSQLLPGTIEINAHKIQLTNEKHKSPAANYHYKHVLLNADAAIGNIIDPSGAPICSPVVSPKITIRNQGSDVLNSVEVGMVLDGSPLGAITTLSNLSLATSATSDIIELSPSFTPSAGTHVLKVYTSNPNGNPDTNNGNDTSSVSFTITTAIPLTYKESFESDIFPPANGSDTLNGDAGSVTWQRTNQAGSPGSASIFMNGFSYEDVGQRDIYRTGKINVATLDSVVVFFSVAYKEFEGAADSLLVLYSPDCGATWLPTGYAKGGPTLSTSPGTTGADFVPEASEWRVERVAVKDFCSRGIQSIMIGFQSYNDYGNNIYVDGINIAGFASSPRNVALATIDGPAPALCTNSVSPAVSFTNTGLDTIHSLKINYQVDGGAVTTFNWTGSLTRCGEASATLPAGTFTVGTHVLTVFSSEPNGLNDFATSNDTLRKTFTIYNTTPLQPPVVEGFETTGISSWGIQNPDGLITWERTTVAAKTGTSSLWLNNPAADNASSAIDNFISPIIDNSAAADSMFVSWDYAYKSGATYPGSTVLPLDTLEVLVTKDCGVSFTSVWKKWGEELQTVNDPNYSNSIAFIPVASEWKSERIYLTPSLAGGNFQVYFSAKSNKQNNIWLDNVGIISKTLPPRLKSQGYLIYPNPFRNSFLVHHVTPPVELQSMQVYNSMGQLVWENHYNGSAATEVTIDLGNVSNGVYVLKMIYSNKTVVERIVKH